MSWQIIQNKFPRDTLVLYNEEEGIYRKVSARIQNIGDQQVYTEEEIDFADRKFEEVKRDFEVGSALYKIIPEHVPMFISMDINGGCDDIFDILQLTEGLENIKECITVVTKKVEGITFYDWLIDKLDNNTLRLKDYLRVLIAIFSIHRKLEPNFTHFDLHIENVLIDNNNEVHLLDFGASFYQNASGQVLGQNIPEFGRVARYFWMHDAVNILMSTLNHTDQYTLLDFFENAIPDLVEEAFPGTSQDYRNRQRTRNRSGFMLSSKWNILEWQMDRIDVVKGPYQHLLNHIYPVVIKREIVNGNRPKTQKLYFSVATDYEQEQIADFIIEALHFMQVDAHDFTWQFTLLRPLDKYINTSIGPFYQFLLDKLNEL